MRPEGGGSSRPVKVRASPLFVEGRHYIQFGPCCKIFCTAARSRMANVRFFTQEAKNEAGKGNPHFGEAIIFFREGVFYRREAKKILGEGNSFLRKGNSFLREVKKILGEGNSFLREVKKILGEGKYFLGEGNS